MQKNNTLAGMITRTYIIGAVVLLIFYGAVIHYFTLFTENMNSVRRLMAIAPHHFDKFKHSDLNVIKIDPLLSIYNNYTNLPESLQQHLDPNWVGTSIIHASEGEEFSIFATTITLDSNFSIMYAIENIELIEWGDIDILIAQLGILSLGILFFLVTATFIVRSAKQISEPVSNLSQQLEKTDESYAPLIATGKFSSELSQMLTAINSYRSKVKKALMREQSFTRYISHEFRTPMTVIKGSVSILRKNGNEKADKHLGLIDTSLNEMEQLTQTFLQLTREKLEPNTIVINKHYINNILANFNDLLIANNVKINTELLSPFKLQVHPLLMSAVINNLLKNAINCSLGGQISVFVCSQRIDIIDNGLGLDAKPRGYEGFGIGLKIVTDICRKYNWQFELKNNTDKGCRASILF